jgi:hypothetical protein
VLGRTTPVKFGPFWDVELDNHVTLGSVDIYCRHTKAATKQTNEAKRSASLS